MTAAIVNNLCYGYSDCWSVEFLFHIAAVELFSISLKKPPPIHVVFQEVSV